MSEPCYRNTQKSSIPNTRSFFLLLQLNHHGNATEIKLLANNNPKNVAVFVSCSCKNDANLRQLVCHACTSTDVLHYPLSLFHFRSLSIYLINMLFVFIWMCRAFVVLRNSQENCVPRHSLSLSAPRLFRLPRNIPRGATMLSLYLLPLVNTLICSPACCLHSSRILILYILRTLLLFVSLTNRLSFGHKIEFLFL